MFYKIDIFISSKDFSSEKYTFRCAHDSLILNKGRIVNFIKALECTGESALDNNVLLLESNGDTEIIYYNDPKNIKSINVKIELAGLEIS